mgnify:CR=1 FL=1
MITTIFLDLDDTLFSFQQAEQVALKETMRHYTLPYSDEILALYSAGNDAQWKLLEQGKVQRSEIGYRRFDLLLTHLGSDLDREEVNRYYMERLSSRHFLSPRSRRTALRPPWALYPVSGLQRHRLGTGRAAEKQRHFAFAGPGVYLRVPGRQ